jgi:pyruvate dehydrogenase E2 component (dihydrolipoamide acetyltransferase)
LARRIAEMNKIPLNKVDGSGPEGRIVKSDIEKYKTETSNRSAEKVETPQMPDQAAKIPTVQMGNQQETQSGTTPAAKPGTVPPPADQQTKASSVMPFSAEAIPVSAKRRIIAQRLSESKFSAPHYYLTVSVAADNLIKERKNLNDAMKDKISFNSFLIKYSAEALKKHSMVNAAWQGDTILKYRNADIALAVAQTDGLITPVVRDCGNKGLIDIDKELKVLIEKARSNALVPEEYQGATFTISNLGSYGIEQFTAVINPPASAILAVGEMKKVPVVDDNNNFIVQTQMKLTLSCDHRVIDGAVGAAFIKNLKDIIENPIRALF